MVRWFELTCNHNHNLIINLQNFWNTYSLEVQNLVFLCASWVYCCCEHDNTPPAMHTTRITPFQHSKILLEHPQSTFIWHLKPYIQNEHMWQIPIHHKMAQQPPRTLNHLQPLMVYPIMHIRSSHTNYYITNAWATKGNNHMAHQIPLTLYRPCTL